MSAAAWASITLVFVVLLLVCEARDARRGIAVTKTIASTGFVGVAVASGAANTPYGRAILVALVLSWLGDVLLIPKGAKAAFLGGLVAFLLGHVAYAFAFTMQGTDLGASGIAAAVLALGAFSVGRMLVRAAPSKLRVPVMAYIAVISTMVATAVGAVATGADIAILVGAVMFYFSDLGVARDRFVQKSFWNKAVLLPLYYGAQVIFALSV